MRNILVVTVCLLLCGCASLFGSKSVDTEKRVRTLGVLPILIDVDTVEYSNPDGLEALLEESSQGVVELLIEQLRSKGNYFDVRKIDLPPSQLIGQIVSSRLSTGEGTLSHYTYLFDPGEITALVETHRVDAILAIVIHGVKRPEKRWNPHSTRFEYLEAEYRSLLYTAAVVAAPADQLWLRPISPGDYFLRLDYPDFTEAFWNRTDEVHVKEISLAGLQRRLAEPEDGLFAKTELSKKCNAIVRNLVDDLKNGL